MAAKGATHTQKRLSTEMLAFLRITTQIIEYFRYLPLLIEYVIRLIRLRESLYDDLLRSLMLTCVVNIAQTIRGAGYDVERSPHELTFVQIYIKGKITSYTNLLK